MANRAKELWKDVLAGMRAFYEAIGDRRAEQEGDTVDDIITSMNEGDWRIEWLMPKRWYQRNLFREITRLNKAYHHIWAKIMEMENEARTIRFRAVKEAEVRKMEESLPKRIEVMSTRLHNLEKEYSDAMGRIERLKEGRE